MKTRIISGIGIFAVLTFTVLFYNTIFSNIAALRAFLMSLVEIKNAFNVKNTRTSFVVLAFVGTYLIMIEYLPIKSAMLPIVVLMACYGIVTVFNFDKIDIRSVSSSFMYGIYSMVGFFSLILYKVVLPYNSFDYDATFLFAMSILIAWVGDSAAYFSGFLFGKHKMAPKLSPKKTIEGAIGGVLWSGVLSVGLLYIYSILKQYLTSSSVTIETKTIVLWAFIGVFGYALGMIGDLFASAVKRQVGIKDYSNLIPGHGGILDRFDSVIIISPAFVILSSYIASQGGLFNV